MYGYVQLNRRGTQAPMILAQGYISSTATPTWPGGVLEPQVSGQGFLASQAVSSPGAGSDFNVFGVANTRAQLMGIIATLTTSAAVANRLVTMTLNDSVRNCLQVPAAAVQAASTAVTYCFTPVNAPFGPVGGLALVAMPTPTKLMNNWRLATATQNLQAADQWSSITASFEQWFDE
jgi:hypothetical protein